LISDDAAGTFELLLAVCDQRLELRETGPRAAGPILVDFVNGPVGFRRLSSGSRAQPIASAVGLRSGVTRVVDATAGLARDAFLLACLGCFVTAIERSAVLGALVQDGLARASTDGPTDLAPVLDRITFLTADARHWLAGLSESDKPDVVYLDPMYPPKTKTAKAKKEPRICRKLVGDDPDAAELSDIARRTARRRVVVKRHRHAPALGPEPDLRFAGKQVRYDVYLVQP
jgi:16S rRNA (guanine1516-N2)-methyltransferase